MRLKAYEGAIYRILIPLPILLCDYVGGLMKRRYKKEGFFHVKNHILRAWNRRAHMLILIEDGREAEVADYMTRFPWRDQATLKNLLRRIMIEGEDKVRSEINRGLQYA